jgi:hypothetical protein
MRARKSLTHLLPLDDAVDSGVGGGIDAGSGGPIDWGAAATNLYCWYQSGWTPGSISNYVRRLVTGTFGEIDESAANLANFGRGPAPASQGHDRLGLRRRSHACRPAHSTRRLAFAVLGASALQVGACASDPAKPQNDGADPCTPPDVTLRTANAAELFDATTVPVFDLYLPEADWPALQVDAHAEAYVPAQGCYVGRALGTVGLRFKGSYGSLYQCNASMRRETSSARGSA